MSSILTNNSAMVALQTLKSINKGLATTQSQIATGKKVASAADNAATWAISKGLESDVKGLSAIKDNLALGSSTVAVARVASETITDLLTEIKGKITLSEGASDDERTKLQADVDALRDQIQSVVDSANFNGTNLLKGGDDLDLLSTLETDDGGDPVSRITVSSVSFSQFDSDGTTALTGTDTISGPDAAGTANAVDLAAIDISSATTSDDFAAIEGMIQQAIDAAAAFGSAQTRIDIQSDFIGSLTDSLKSGIGSLVDTDMEEASARLQALQVQQQLGVQSLSIANQAPQTILALFR